MPCRTYKLEVTSRTYRAPFLILMKPSYRSTNSVRSNHHSHTPRVEVQVRRTRLQPLASLRLALRCGASSLSLSLHALSSFYLCPFLPPCKIVQRYAQPLFIFLENDIQCSHTVCLQPSPGVASPELAGVGIVFRAEESGHGLRVAALAVGGYASDCPQSPALYLSRSHNLFSQRSMT